MYQTQQKLKLDIIIIGYEEDKEKLRNVVDSLQSQLNKQKRKDVGVMFAFGNRENIEEVKGKSLGMTNSEYVVILDCTETFNVMPNYIDSLLKIISDNEEKENGVQIIISHGINKLK